MQKKTVVTLTLTHYGKTGVISALETQYMATKVLCPKEVGAAFNKLIQLGKFNPAKYGMETPAASYDWQSGGPEACLCEFTSLGLSHDGVLEGPNIGYASVEALMDNIAQGGDPEYESRSVYALRAEIDRLHPLDHNRSRLCVVEVNGDGQIESVSTDDASEKLVLVAVDSRVKAKAGGEVWPSVNGTPASMTYINSDIDNTKVGWHSLLADLTDTSFVRYELKGNVVKDLNGLDSEIVAVVEEHLPLSDARRLVGLLNEHYV